MAAILTRFILGFALCMNLSWALRKSYILSFSENDEISTEEWAVFKGKIPHLYSFTACDWEYLNYFNIGGETCPWAYCYRKHEGDEKNAIQCTQFWQQPHGESAGTQLLAWGGFGDKSYFKVHVKKFRHRTWNHFCWTFNSKDGKNRIYFNGELTGEVTVFSNYTKRGIEGTDEAFDSYFIYGQEPDYIGPPYSDKENFQGKATEFNLWDRILSDKEISDLAKCNSSAQGNVISWEKENFDIVGAKVYELADMASLCKPVKNIVMFPQKKSLADAKTLCAAHGGKIFVPVNAGENKEMTGLIEGKEAVCKQQDDTGNLAWIGVHSRDRIFYAMSDKKYTRPLNYTNFWRIPYFSHLDCAFFRADGSWADAGDCHTFTKICTVCQIMNTPALVMKGLCNQAKISWVWYMVVDKESGEISYDGYKNSRIKLRDGNWVFEERGTFDQDGSTILMSSGNDNGIYPMGTRSWSTPFMSDCPQSENLTLTLSSCIFGAEFSCRDGRCISIYKRCDSLDDCLDGSDEEDCLPAEIPESYDKAEAAEFPKDMEKANPIEVSIAIVNIDFLNTVTMTVGLTIETKLRWRDRRLTFLNILDSADGFDTFRDVPATLYQQIWLPMPKIVHENAVIGQVKKDDNLYVQIHPKKEPEIIDAEKPTENLKFLGSDNDLVMIQRFKLEYRCDFFLKIFPFDQQKCNFIMKLKVQSNTSVMFVESPEPVVYEGPKILTEFEVGDITSETKLTNRDAFFTYSIQFKRLYISHITSTYFQTFLLWFLAYITVYIQVQDFTNRFMGSVTALLVLAALLASIGDKLPQTSYFKYIDLWFMVYILNIIILIIFHVFIDNIYKSKRFISSAHKISEISGVKSKQDMRNSTPTTTLATAEKYNNFAKIFLPSFILGFTIVYFVVSAASDPSA